MPQDFSKYADHLNLLYPTEPNSTPVPQTFDPAHPESFAKYLELLTPQPQTPQPSPAETIASTPPTVREPVGYGAVAGVEAADSVPVTQPVVSPKISALPQNMEVVGGQPSPASQENLINALKTQGDLNLTANLGRSFDKIGSSIARVPNEENPVYKSIEAQSGEPIKAFGLVKENEKNDPNSNASVFARQFLRDKLNIKVSDNIAFGDIEKQYPIITTAINKQMATQQHASSLAETSRHNKELERIAGQNANTKTTTAETKPGADKEKHQSTALQQTQSFLETSRQDPAVRQAMLDKYNVQKAERIFKGRNLNNLSNQEVGLLVSEISKVARGGVPTQDELHAISPNALTGKLSKVWSQLLNKPTPAYAGEFLTDYQNYLKELKANAEDTISSKVRRVIEGKKKELGDENYRNLKDLYSDMLSPGGEPSRSLQSVSSDDQAAIDWAKKNPSDTRAAQILKMHGM